VLLGEVVLVERAQRDADVELKLNCKLHLVRMAEKPVNPGTLHLHFELSYAKSKVNHKVRTSVKYSLKLNAVI
jgi:hypothetical protein